MTELYSATFGPIVWERHDDGIVVLTFDALGKSANTYDEVFKARLPR